MQQESITLEMMEAENKSLRADLDDCKKRLFELVYEEDPIASATIRKDYENICDAIENWIDEVFKEEDFRKRFSSILKGEPQMLTELGLLEVTRDSDGNPIYDIGTLESMEVQWMRWLENIDTCNYIVISLVIWHYLETKIFVEWLPIGTTPDQSLLINEILQHKKKDLGEGTSIQISKWRSETLTAMAKTPSFKATRKLELNARFTELTKIMEEWIGERNTSLNKESLRNDVFNPVVELHLSMRCSKEEYSVEEARVTRHQVPDKVWVLKNIQAWRTVNCNNTDDLYRVFHSLSPGLYRFGTGNDKTCDVKPVVVIYSMGPSQRLRIGPSPQRSSEGMTKEMTQDGGQRPRRRSPSPNSSQSDRPSNSRSLFSGFKSKKRSSEPKRKPLESRPSEPRSKSSTSHRPRSRKPSYNHDGDRPAGHRHQDRYPLHLPTTSEPQQDYGPPDQRPQWSYMAPEEDHSYQIQVAREDEYGRSYDPTAAQTSGPPAPLMSSYGPVSVADYKYLPQSDSSKSSEGMR